MLVYGVSERVKTTICLELAKRLDVQRLNTDDIREELTGDSEDQSVNQQAWDLLYARAKNLIEEGKPVIIDATHAASWYRIKDAARYKEYGAKEVIGLYVQSPTDIVKQRNKSRGRMVPEHAIERHQNNLNSEPPALSDGFSKIIEIQN